MDAQPVYRPDILEPLNDYGSQLLELTLLLTLLQPLFNSV